VSTYTWVDGCVAGWAVVVLVPHLVVMHERCLAQHTRPPNPQHTRPPNPQAARSTCNPATPPCAWQVSRARASPAGVRPPGRPAPCRCGSCPPQPGWLQQVASMGGRERG